MYIIDRHKDFYDHFSYIYGLDKSIVFDRRNSIRMTNEMLVGLAVETYRRHRPTSGFVLLEIGDVQYLIKLSDVEYGGMHELEVKDYSVELVHTYDEHRHLFPPVMSIRRTSVRTPWFWRTHRDKDEYEIPPLDDVERYGARQESIDLPILSETKLTSVLDAQQIWSVLQNYISSLDNDKDISIPMTDVEKAATHGFDKQSFRHPVK